MKEYIISADIISFIFMAVILCGVFMSSLKNRKTSTKMFIILLFTDLIAIIVDVCSYITEGNIQNDECLIILNLFAYAFAVVLIDIFSFYMISVIRERITISYKILIPVMVVSVLNYLMIIIGSFNEKLFIVENHFYQTGEWAIGTYLFAILYILYLWGILIKYYKELRIKFVLGLSTYLFFPFLFLIGVILFKIPVFTYASASVSLLIIYVTIQAQTITEVLLREKILNEVTHLDSLTGLQNRRAYTELLQGEEKSTKKAVAFFDLNGLKFTNDTYGHAAGDILIKNFSDLLLHYFSQNEIFRISGDEFVVIKQNVHFDEFEEIILSLHTTLEAHNRIAAMGYVTGEKDSLLQLIHTAEKNMYLDKNKYYKETGKIRRT